MAPRLNVAKLMGGSRAFKLYWELYCESASSLFAHGVARLALGRLLLLFENRRSSIFVQEIRIFISGNCGFTKCASNKSLHTKIQLFR